LKPQETIEALQPEISIARIESPVSQEANATNDVLKGNESPTVCISSEARLGIWYRQKISPKSGTPDAPGYAGSIDDNRSYICLPTVAVRVYPKFRNRAALEAHADLSQQPDQPELDASH
jgi:hypothetical protein